MKPPYHTRLLIVREGHEPVELCRYRHSLSNYERNFWLRDLSPDWLVIEEHTCRKTLTPRVVLAQSQPVRVVARLASRERGEIVYEY